MGSEMCIRDRDDRDPIFTLHGWDLEFVRNLAIQNRTPLTTLQERKYLQSANTDMPAGPNTAGQVESKTSQYFSINSLLLLEQSHVSRNGNNLEIFNVSCYFFY